MLEIDKSKNLSNTVDDCSTLFEEIHVSERTPLRTSDLKDKCLEHSRSKNKKVAIIGAGVSGIISGSVLNEDGHHVTVFEKSNIVGGVWVNAYPEARLQNTWDQYYHPDFPPCPKKRKGDGQSKSNSSSSGLPVPDLHPTAPYIQKYFQNCSDHFTLDVKLNTAVLDMTESPTGGWTVTSQSQGNDDKGTAKITEAYDFVVIAQGHFNRDIHIPWKGVKSFEAGGGTILQRTQVQDLDVLKGKKVVVVGYGKTAVDMCTFSVEHGAAETTHIFRQSRFLIPMYIGGVHNSWLIFNRCHNHLIPCWGHPSKAWSFLHKVFPALFAGIWWLLQQIAWLSQSRPAWFAPPEIRRRVKLLKSKSHILKDHRGASALCPPNFFPYVSQGKILPIQGDVQELTSKGLMLKSGKDIEADIILACIGNESYVSTFPYLPTKYQEIFQQQANHVHGLQLYRHILSPDIPSVAFMGWNAGFLHCTHVYLSSIWLSSMLRGELHPPSKEEQRNMCTRMSRWKIEHIHHEPTLNSAVHTRMLHYNDTILRDLGLKPYRKGNFVEEIFGRYGPSDYEGVQRLVQERRSKDDITNGIGWTPIEVDM